MIFSSIITFNLLLLNVGTLEGASLPEIYTKDSKPFDIPYEEWMVKWWQWDVTIPASKHPLDNASAPCPVYSIGNVSFLATRFTGKSSIDCTVPSGNAIILSIVSAECDSAETRSEDEQAIRKCASEGNDYAYMEMTVDKIKVPNIENNRIQSKFFNITFPSDSHYGTEPGTFKSLVDGYFVFLKPLPSGDHLITIHAGVDNRLDKSFNFAYDIQISLKVQ